jgi:ribose transport system permease protein/L-arabinose transport system permease protein
MAQAHVHASDRNQAPPSLAVRIVSIVGAQNLALIGGLIVMLLVIRSRNENVFLAANLLDIGVAVSIIGILSIAQMIVIVSGGLDISIGSAAGLASVMTALTITAGYPSIVALLVALLVGAACGAFNGLLVNALKINPVIATLATFGGFSGLALVVSGGRAIAARDDVFRYVGVTRWFGLPVTLILLIVLAILAHIFLSYTVIGRRIYALGSNPNAARNSGIHLIRYRMGIYIMSGIAAGLAGAMIITRTRVGEEAGSSDLGLTAITAALLGGAALTGGRGTIVGVMLAVIILGVLNNGLILTGTPPFWSNVALGAFLILAVAGQEADLPTKFRAWLALGKRGQ